MSMEPDITVFRSDHPSIYKVLNDLEANIMELIRAPPDQQSMTVRDVGSEKQITVFIPNAPVRYEFSVLRSDVHSRRQPLLQ